MMRREHARKIPTHSRKRIYYPRPPRHVVRGRLEEREQVQELAHCWQHWRNGPRYCPTCIDLLEWEGVSETDDNREYAEAAVDLCNDILTGGGKRRDRILRQMEHC